MEVPTATNDAIREAIGNNCASHLADVVPLHPGFALSRSGRGSRGGQQTLPLNIQVSLAFGHRWYQGPVIESLWCPEALSYKSFAAGDF